MTNEKDVALMEAHRIIAVDAYFDARPNLDSSDARRMFEAGFQRGWEAREVKFISVGGGGGPPASE